MEERKIHVMVVGAHAGDAELMAGGLLAKYHLLGHKTSVVHMTLGEKGNRALTPEEYAKQKRREAEAAAKVLGADVYFLPFKDAELPYNDEAAYMLCDIIREAKPNLIITHWKGSIHKDHTNTHHIVHDAQFYAALPTIERKLPAHGCWTIAYAENWEDPKGFEPDTYVDITAGYDLFIEAAKCYEMVSGKISSFRYLDYYEALATTRGCLSGFQKAECYMMPEGALIRKSDRFPGF